MHAVSAPRREFRLFAIMMVRNEASIILDSLGHLLCNLGVDGVFVADNGSEDETPALLARVAERYPQLRWRSCPGGFEQHRITSALAREAFEAGADWILPVDADEFFDPGAAGFHPLSEAWEIGAFSVPVRNFVAWPLVQSLSWGSSGLRGLVASAEPQGPWQEARALVEAGAVPYVGMAYPPKLLFRAAAGIDVERGCHGAVGLAGRVEPLPGAAFLHAPLRSFDDMRRRAEHGARLAAVEEDASIGWHVRRLIGLTPEGLRREWRANTMHALPLGGGPRHLRPDLRLARIARSLRAFRAEMLGKRQGAAAAPTTPGICEAA